MAARKVEATTVVTKLIKDGYIKPKSPLFIVLNDGSCDVLINNLRLKPGDSFGVNADAIVAQCLEKGIPVVNNTQYQIYFDIPAAGTFSVGAQLIETFIKLV